MITITASDVEANWPVLPVRPLELTIRDVNNRSFLVTAREGLYILRWYQNVDVTVCLPFEYELLRVLADANLPFAVPSSLSTGRGDRILKLHRDGETLPLALFPRIPGHAPVHGSRTERSRAQRGHGAGSCWSADARSARLISAILTVHDVDRKL